MSDNTIVVGVDSSPEANAALQWAVDEARLRNCEIVVVHAWNLTAFAMIGSYGYALDAQPLQEAGQQILDDVMKTVLDSGVSARGVVLEGSASGAIIAAAKDARLVVVGARGHGGFAGLLLGSVSTQVVHHAPCPVVVVPLPPG